MSTLAKLGLVLGGYVLACLVASGVLDLYQLFTQSTAVQAFAGMFAFGDLVLFLGIFGILALLPTRLALTFVMQRWKTR